MKKIIYSLVAMLFMGGIITSCIPNTEPDGVKEMRLAHADYLRALADLTTANKDVVAADAAVKNAQAAIKRAKADQEAAKARAAEMKNELQAAKDQQEIANILDAMEKDRVTNAAALERAKIDLAKAQKELEDALAAIEIEKLAMSTEEAKALAAIKEEYDKAAAKLKAWYEDYQAEYELMYDLYYYYLLWQAMGGSEYVDPYFADYSNQDIEDWLLDHYGVDLFMAGNQEEFIAEQIKLYEFDLENQRKQAEFWKGLLEDMDFDYLAEAQKYEDEANAMAPEFADLLRDSVLFENEYGTARDRAINAANDAYDEAKDAPLKAYKEAIKALKDANKGWAGKVNEVAEADIDNPLKNWTGKKVGYAFSKKYALPEHVAGDVVDLYETQAGLNGFAQNVEFIKTAGKPDSLKVTIEAQKDSAAYATIVDTVWNGNQATEKLLKMKTGLKSVYDDFGRAYLYDLDAEGIKADKDILEAYAKKVQSQYDSLLKILKSAEDGNGKALVAAWFKKADKAGKDIEALAKKIDEYQNYTGDAKNDVYTWDDKVFATSTKGPRLMLNYDNAGRLISQATDDATHFILDAVTTPWFDVAPTARFALAPTHADSVTVFNAIKDYFTAVASVNEKAVPYLKFIAAEGVGTFKVDSLRADKIEFAGMQMKPTNAYLESLGIHRAAPYDNKAIMNIATPPTNASLFVDAFTNLMQLFNHYVHGDPLTLPFYTADDAAYTAATSGVADYVQYVKDFKDTNAESKLGYFMKDFGAYTAADFKKYSQMSAEGKAVANWMDACQRYFGVEGFAGIGEKVFFVKETFVEPENIAVFAGIPTYGAENLKKIANNKIPYTNALGRVDVVTPWTYQFEFAADAIENNIAVFDGAAAAADYVVNNNDMVMKSIVFELLEADYLVALANGEKSVSEIWAELGKVLEQVKADMDAVVGSTKAAQKANDDLAKKFQDALNTYRKATKDLKDERDAAIKAANDAYDAAKKEILDPISEKYVELRNKYNDLMNLADGLRGAYATLWAGGAPDTDALLEYLYQKYTDALEAADWDEYYIAQLKVLAGLITIEDPTLDEIQETIDLIQDILDEMDWDEYYDLEFWYEYWKAAYEAAVARFAE